MAQEATIKINVEQGNSAKTLGDLKKEVDAVGNSAEKVNDEFIQGQAEAEKKYRIFKDSVKTVKRRDGLTR